MNWTEVVDGSVFLTPQKICKQLLVILQEYQHKRQQHYERIQYMNLPHNSWRLHIDCLIMYFSESSVHISIVIYNLNKIILARYVKLFRTAISMFPRISMS